MFFEKKETVENSAKLVGTIASGFTPGPEDAIIGGVLVSGGIKKVAGKTAAKCLIKLEKDADKVDNISNLAIRIKSRIDLYPKIIDPRTKRYIPFPSSITKKIPKGERVIWDKTERAKYIAEWHKRGYETPREGWDKYDIHHIQPRELGGNNDFWNLVPVEKTNDHALINKFWREYIE